MSIVTGNENEPQILKEYLKIYTSKQKKNNEKNNQIFCRGSDLFCIILLGLFREEKSPEIRRMLGPEASLRQGLELICESHRMVLAGSTEFPSKQCFIVCHAANTFAVLILPDCELFSFLLLGHLTKENYKQTNKILLFVPVSADSSVKFSSFEEEDWTGAEWVNWDEKIHFGQLGSQKSSAVESAFL